MEDLENTNLQESKPKNEVVFDCSIESEVDRMKWTLRRIDWYKEKGYKPKLPKLVQGKLEGGGKVTDDDIVEAVSEEFGSEKDRKQIESLQKEWKDIKDEFFINLRTLNLPVQEKYFVSLTKYGTGGSYHGRDHVQLNIEQKSAVLILAHEIIHLTIQPLITKYDVEHWTKERLVDLIMNKFFPEKPMMQRDPENAEQISEIFEKGFPDIEKIILEISKL